MSNSKGSYSTTTERTMAAYDKLPPTARRALQEAVLDWAPQPLYSKWRDGRKGWKTGKDLAAKVRDWDRDYLAKKQRERAYFRMTLDLQRGQS